MPNSSPMIKPVSIPTYKGFRSILGLWFGRLHVISYAGREGYFHLWNCRCLCGRLVVVRQNNLETKHTKSCGCVNIEKPPRARHRGSHSPEWDSWQHMKRRCENSKDASYHNYGGRGIRVCKRWLESFDNFIADMGKRPTAGHTLERKNNNGHYTPENCRWATRLEQASNTRRSHRITVNGVTLTIEQWARHTGISSKAIHRRIQIGWDKQRAVTAPLRQRNKNPGRTGVSV